MGLFMWQDDIDDVAGFIAACLGRVYISAGPPIGTRHLINPDIAGKVVMILSSLLMWQDDIISVARSIGACLERVYKSAGPPLGDQASMKHLISPELAGGDVAILVFFPCPASMLLGSSELMSPLCGRNGGGRLYILHAQSEVGHCFAHAPAKCTI